MVQYLHDVAAWYKVVNKVQLKTDVTELKYIENDAEWKVTLSHLTTGMGDVSKANRTQRGATSGKGQCAHLPGKG